MKNVQIRGSIFVGGVGVVGNLILTWEHYTAADTGASPRVGKYHTEHVLEILNNMWTRGVTRGGNPQ